MITLSLKRYVGTSFAILVFLLCCVSLANAQVIFQQSSCFTITIAASSDSCGTTQKCGTPNLSCDVCYEITIKSDKCPGLNPTSFIFSSNQDQNGDCRFVCSPSGDFVVTNWLGVPIACSWGGPRTLTYTGAGGLQDLATAKFLLCRQVGAPSPVRYQISCGCSCNGVPCTTAVIDF